MIIRIDWFKIAWMVAWTAAVVRGELPWWALAGLVCYYFMWPFTWVSPKTLKEHDAQQAYQALNQALLDHHTTEGAHGRSH